MGKKESKKQKGGVPKLTQPAPPHPELDWLPKFYPGNPVLRQNRAAGKALNSLARYADSGSKNSACLLVQLATDLVRWMSFGRSRGSDLIRSLAPEFATWPVLASGHPAAIRDLKKELNRLRVGYVSGFRSDAGARWGMKWDKLHGVTVAIINGIFHLQQHLRHCAHAVKQGKKIDYSKLYDWEKQCEHLPPFNRDNFPQWKPILRAAINSRRLEYLADPDLREVGRLRGGHRGGTDACIFDGIKQAILQTAIQLADKSSFH